MLDDGSNDKTHVGRSLAALRAFDPLAAAAAPANMCRDDKQKPLVRRAQQDARNGAAPPEVERAWLRWRKRRPRRPRAPMKLEGGRAAAAAAPARCLQETLQQPGLARAQQPDAAQRLAHWTFRAGRWRQTRRPRSRATAAARDRVQKPRAVVRVDYAARRRAVPPLPAFFIDVVHAKLFGHSATLSSYALRPPAAAQQGALPGQERRRSKPPRA